MKKRLVILGIVVLLVCVGLCTNNPFDIERNKFIGTWTIANNSSIGITLFSNGTCSWGGLDKAWELKEGKFVTMSIVLHEPVTEIYLYSFSNNDRALTLITPENITLIFAKK